MSKLSKPAAPEPRQNQILAALPKAEYERLLPDLELVEMPLGWTMSEVGDHVKYLHFPISGIIALIYALEDGSSSETALVGSEGLVGISIYMGGESLPSSTEVQSPGHAYRLSRKVMKREFEEGGQLQRLALLYTQALICQTSQTAVCNQHHSVEQQFSRWLLMSFDRLHSTKMMITHEQISHFLGVRRVSVTQTAGKLEKEGLITKARGSITVVDRARLEEVTCECYAAVKAECQRLLPQPKTSHDEPAGAT
ncbi:MAG: Crp/Fnr family transcriptional regulator [Burkholderiaceae bacterium]|nr:Crp/Fnr family transcriptional regulator [Burkholderiaceae bacterium]MDO9089194.1 Crp/Fnr family transcriptional regulator [Burkholderiaceae bacterium]MDP1969086.1 Crp/Fnr family transcriptional regulator [Burkholderiaceae bacterium]